MSKSCVRWRTNVSTSWNEPGSSSFSIRSRAVYLPRSCCLASASGDECTAASRSSLSWASFSSNVSGLCARWVMGRRRLVAPARRSWHVLDDFAAAAGDVEVVVGADDEVGGHAAEGDGGLCAGGWV